LIENTGNTKGRFLPSKLSKISSREYRYAIFWEEHFEWGAFDSAKNHKRQRRKRQSVTAKREKSQTPKFV